MRPTAKRPTLWTRLRVRAAGEIPTDDLRAYRAASLEVWALVESVADRRRSGEVAPIENLGAWIVFAHQTFGNALLDADAHLDPVTADYVPLAIHDLTLRLYRPVGPWLVRAHAGRGGTETTLRRKTPVALPSIPAEQITDLTVINALLIVVRAMAGELPLVASAPTPELWARIEAALVSARYAEGLLPSGTVLGPEDLRRLGPPLRKAAVELFRAGQIAAWPAFGENRPAPT